MPTYVYETIKNDGTSGETFEVMQRMSEDALTQHPETGEPVRRVITAPNISTEHTPGKEKNMLSDKNLDRLGFTKYVNNGSGYDKTAGSGPSSLPQVNGGGPCGTGCGCH